MPFKNGVSVSPSPMEFLCASPSVLQCQMLCGLLLPMPDPWVWRSDVGLRIRWVWGCFYHIIAPPTVLMWPPLCLLGYDLFFFLSFSFFFFFVVVVAISWAAPAAYGGSQARGRIRAVAAGLHRSTATRDPSRICDLHHNHRCAGSEPHLQSTPQLTATPDP